MSTTSSFSSPSRISTQHPARQEQGDWTQCVALVTKNEARVAKMSFKNLGIHMASMSKPLAKNTSLLYLDLSCNNISANHGAVELAVALSHNKTLRKVDLSANILQSSGTAIILKSLEQHPALEWLDLHANSIQDDAIQSISRFVTCNTSIRSLNIRANYLTDATASTLAAVLSDQKRCKLIQIDWGGNDYTAQGEHSLLLAAKANPTIKSLRQTQDSMLADVGCMIS